MPFDSTGNFSRIHNWEQDRMNDIDIVSDRHDEEDDNFAEGLTACVCKDGRSVMSGNLNLGGYRVANLANATAANDAVNKNQLETAISNLENTLTELIKQSVNRRVFIGDVKPSTQTANHGNWLLCNGQAVSRTEYADLFALIGINFGAGDGITTFNVPDYRGKFLRGLGENSAADIYTTQAEGLPNITGKFTNENTSQVDGCFYKTSEDRQIGRSGSDNYNDWFYFDASRSSAIYGASEHVTPVNQAVNWFIMAKDE